MMMNERVQLTLIFGISLSLFSSFLNSSEAEAPSIVKFEIRGSSLVTPSDLGKIALFHNKKRLHISKNSSKLE